MLALGLMTTETRFHTTSIQFLITTGSNLESLDDRNTLFGFVAEGMEAVEKINNTFVDKDGVRIQRSCRERRSDAKVTAFSSTQGSISNHTDSSYPHP